MRIVNWRRTLTGMSSSRYAMEARNRSSANFAHTCNLLSRYVKERGSLKDLNIEIGGKVESLEAIVKPGSSLAASSSGEAKSAHQTSAAGHASGSGDNSTVVVVVEEQQQQDAANRNSTSKEKPSAQRKPEQLTIFYSGKVLVFDDYPMDKARELVSIAKKASSQMSYGILSNTVHEKLNHSARERLPPRPQGKQSVGISLNTCKEKPDLAAGKAAVVSEITNSTDGGAAAASTSKAAQEQLALQSEANGSDLPIARRSSINRFLEKRKDRASGRMPYHNQEQPGSSSSSKVDGELDLNL